MDAESSRVIIDGQGIFFDIAIVNAETVRLRPFRPLTHMAVIFSDFVFQRGAFIFSIRNQRQLFHRTSIIASL
jgi:hypothetical protein